MFLEGRPDFIITYSRVQCCPTSKRTVKKIYLCCSRLVSSSLIIIIIITTLLKVLALHLSDGFNSQKLTKYSCKHHQLLSQDWGNDII